MILLIMIFMVTLSLLCRKYNNAVINFVIVFYLSASVCAVYVNYFISPDVDVTLVSTLYFILITYLFIRPIIFFAKNNHSKFIKLDENTFRIMSWVLILSETFSVCYFFYYDINILASGNFGELRNELILNGANYAGEGFMRTFAGVAAFFYCYNILFFFYSIAFLHESKLFNFLLIASSTSRVFHAISYVGRDGVLFWILSFAFSYFVFSEYLSIKAKKRIKAISFICMMVPICLIIAISISRFDGGWEAVESLIDYFGQPINNFGMVFNRINEYDGTSKILPVLFLKENITAREVVNFAQEFYITYGFYSNTFSSFVGNFYKAWGPGICLVISMAYSYFASRVLNTKNISMSKIIFLMLVVQIPVHNYFYWVYGNRIGNFYLLTIPLFMYICTKKVIIK